MVSLKDSVAAMWAEYKRTKSKASFDALVKHYMPFAKKAAKSFKETLPPSTDEDDLFQAACMGLMRAVRNYDSTRGARLETYAYRPMRGAMLDQIRNEDWVPRLVRARTKKAHAVCRTLFDELGREPIEAEIIAQVGLRWRDTVANRKQLIADTVPASMVTLDGMWSADDDILCEMKAVADRRVGPPDTAAQQEDCKALVKRSLSPNEWQVIELYYYHNLSMQETGDRIGLSESRVSQIHGAVMSRLRLRLADRKEEFVA